MEPLEEKRALEAWEGRVSTAGTRIPLCLGCDAVVREFSAWILAEQALWGYYECHPYDNERGVGKTACTSTSMNMGVLDIGRLPKML